MNTSQLLRQEADMHPTVYNDDRRRKLLMQVAATEMQNMQQAIDDAAQIISSVGTTGIHDKTKQAQEWLEKHAPHYAWNK